MDEKEDNEDESNFIISINSFRFIQRRLKLKLRRKNTSLYLIKLRTQIFILSK